MRTLHTEIDIDATAAEVWAVLTDFEAYPEWNPFVRTLSGELEPGKRLQVHLQAEGGSAFQVRPQVRSVTPDREFSWLGRLGVPGLFDGEHHFRVEPAASGTGVRFIHEEHFRGILVPSLWGKLDAETRRGFEQMNAALKQRAERLSGTRGGHDGS